MQFGDYPTPGDVKIYIGGSLVDDAYRVDYDERNGKVPLTGYHQKYYSMMADGKVIVVGNMIVHFRFPGYLTYAIKTVLSRREEGALADSATMASAVDRIAPPAGSPGVPYFPAAAPETSRKTAYRLSTKDNVLASIAAIRRMSPSDRVKALTASFKYGYFEQHSMLLERMYGTYAQNNDGSGSKDSESTRYDPLESPAVMSPNDFENGQRGIDLRLYYGYIGKEDQGVYVTEVLQGVHFVGRRKVINASTSGGDLSASGQSLLEVYPFIARSVTPLISNNPPAFLGV